MRNLVLQNKILDLLSFDSYSDEVSLAKICRVDSFSITRELELLIQRNFISASDVSAALSFIKYSNIRITDKGYDRLEALKINSKHKADKKNSTVGNRRVFIVHGHDNEVKQSVARLIEKMNLETVILHEQPNNGQTIIEKIEANSDVGFAVILLTPDDFGRCKLSDVDDPTDESDNQCRARQNVILELGYFIGKLGRDKVCALHKGELELPNDFSGVLWTNLDKAEAWKTILCKELIAAGYDIDMNKVL